MSSVNSCPLRLGVLALDQRAINMFRLFLKGPCHNAAVIVDERHAAEAYLVDVDARQGTELLAEYRKARPEAPFIVLSVKRYATSEGLIFVQKPARTEAMQSAIRLARELASEPRTKSESHPEGTEPVATMKVIRSDDRSSKGAAHRVAMLMDEQSFRSYLGHRDDVDPDKPALWRDLFFDPARHLQSWVNAAAKQAVEAGRPIRMETPWKPLYVLPEQRRIWIDAEEAQIRSACAIPFQKLASGNSGSAAGEGLVPEISLLQPSEAEAILLGGKTMTIEACLWKIALWTSRGRLPIGFDPRQTVSLQRWPNFTRVLITPHAMPVAARLWHKPDSLFRVASALGIRQQYVFAFFCATHALGLTQALALSEPAEEVVEAPRSPVPKDAERASLFGKILKRLKVF